MKLYIEKWKDAKKCAVALTWDDFCYHSWKTCLSLFREKGIICTFYINTVGYYENHSNQCSTNEIRLLKVLQKFGHEIGCHTHSHIDMSHESPKVIQQEIQSWFSNMKQYKFNLPNDVTFAYPYGNIPRNNKVVKKRFLAARSYKQLGINSYNPRNFYNLKTVNYLTSTKPCYLNNFLNQNLKTGGFLIYAGHGIDNECWNPISKSSLNSHLCYIHARKKQIWNDTVVNIVKYIKQRNKIKLKYLTKNDNFLVFRLIVPKFKFTCIPITIGFISNQQVHSITQGKRAVAFQQDGTKYHFTVDVNQKKIKIHLPK